MKKVLGLMAVAILLTGVTYANNTASGGKKKKAKKACCSKAKTCDKSEKTASM